MALELSEVELKIPAVYLRETIVSTIRLPEPEETMEFKRRFSEFRAKGKTIKTDAQIAAVDWYYNKLALKVEGLTWKGKDVMEAFADEVGRWKKCVPFEVKDTVVGYLRAELGEDEDEQKNS